MANLISKFALLFAVLGFVSFAVPAQFAGAEDAENTDVAAPADDSAEESGEAADEDAEGEAAEEAQPE